MTKVTIDRALIEQVIEAFETYATQYPHMWKGYLIDAEQALRAALAEPAVEHWSDCATNKEPAYPAGACDCMPTPAMCRAAVEYVNGADVYEKVPREALDIEEGIYREVWIAMQAASPPPAQPVVEPVAWLHTNRLGGVQAFTSEPPPGLKELCVPLYTSPPPPAEPARTSQDVCTVPLLSDEEIDACDEVARKSFRYSQGRVCGQMLKPSDSFDWHFARAIEQLVRRKAGL